MSQLVGRCTWHRASLDRDLEAIQDSGIDRDCVNVRDQARFVEVSTTAVARATLKSVSTRYLIAQDEAIRNITFKSRCLICENMTKVQPSDVRSHQSEIVS